MVNIRFIVGHREGAPNKNLEDSKKLLKITFELRATRRHWGGTLKGPARSVSVEKRRRGHETFRGHGRAVRGHGGVSAIFVDTGV